MLKNKQLDGCKFRRQHSVDNYILDFYCPEEKLAEELDGAQHHTSEGMAYDIESTQYLNYYGIQVIRFANKLVIETPEVVLEKIRKQFIRPELGKNLPWPLLEKRREIAFYKFRDDMK